MGIYSFNKYLLFSICSPYFLLSTFTQICSPPFSACSVPQQVDFCSTWAPSLQASTGVWSVGGTSRHLKGKRSEMWCFLPTALLHAPHFGPGCVPSTMTAFARWLIILHSPLPLGSSDTTSSPCPFSLTGDNGFPLLLVPECLTMPCLFP